MSSAITGASTGSGRGLLLGRRFELGLELGDALGRLTQPFTALAELLLQPFGFDGGLLQVLVDVVPVVSLEGLTKLDGTERIEGRLGCVHGPILVLLPSPP